MRSTFLFRANLSGEVEQRIPCPICDRGAADRALGVNIQTGAFHCFRCHWKGRTRDVAENSAGPRRVDRIDAASEEPRKRARLERIWRESVPLCSPKAHAVRRYLAARGLSKVLDQPPTTLRAHAALPYFDSTALIGSFPAMIAELTGVSGQPATLHVTYLRGDGTAKAAVPQARKLLPVPVRGSTKGSAIRLYGPKAGVLGVAEGIESALSLGLLRGIPVWAAYCADNLGRVALPDGLREVLIGVDVDTSGVGERVARMLSSRLRSSPSPPRVRLLIPDGEGPRDCNDALRRHTA